MKAELLVFLQDQLELRVGEAIAAQLSLRELDEFGRFLDDEDEDGAFCWLKDHVPEYGAVVREETVRLRDDLARSADEMARLGKPDNAGASK